MKGDRALYAVLFAIMLASSLASMGWLFAGVSDRLTMEISVAGEIAESRELRHGETYRRVISGDWGYNAYEVDDRSVRIVSSDCGGGDCLLLPATGANGGALVCMPHRLVIRVRARSSGWGRVDGVSY